MVKSSLVDGGPYVCSHESHEGDFTTENPDEWQEHLDGHKDDAVKFGSRPCGVCGEIVVYTNVPVGMSPVHAECLKKLAGQSQGVSE